MRRTTAIGQAGGIEQGKRILQLDHADVWHLQCQQPSRSGWLEGWAFLLVWSDKRKGGTVYAPCLLSLQRHQESC